MAATISQQAQTWSQAFTYNEGMQFLRFRKNLPQTTAG